MWDEKCGRGRQVGSICERKLEREVDRILCGMENLGRVHVKWKI